VEKETDFKKQEPMLFFLIDLFNSIPEQKGLNGNNTFTSDGYIILYSSVACETLHNLYLKLIQVDVKPIEILPVAEKNKYWEIAKRYYTEKDLAIRASKAAYMITILTNS